MGKKARFIPTIDPTQWIFPSFSSISRPKSLGNQK
jgi:hypothetical protein